MFVLVSLSLCEIVNVHTIHRFGLMFVSVNICLRSREKKYVSHIDLARINLASVKDES